MTYCQVPLERGHTFSVRGEGGRGNRASCMSIRTLHDSVEHVTIRGTSVSTSFAFPSLLHVSVVHKFGLPNRNGVISCDDYLVHLRFDVKNDALVHVWASRVEEETGWSCVIT